MWRECSTLFSNIVLQDSVVDQWKWLSSPDKGYSVCDVYHHLTAIDHIECNTLQEVIWNKIVPLKVSIFVWRMFRNRLSTKDNLERRGVIQLNSNTCIIGCGQHETLDHLFVKYQFFGRLWSLFRHWMRITFVDTVNLSDHVLHFSSLCGFSKGSRSSMHVVWLASLGTHLA